MINRVGLPALGQVAADSLAAVAKGKMGAAAEASHLAALAADKLEAGRDHLGPEDLAQIARLLREAQNAAHLAYVRQGGSEADYQAFGKKVTSKHLTPSGRWRVKL